MPTLAEEWDIFVAQLWDKVDHDLDVPDQWTSALKSIIRTSFYCGAQASLWALVKETGITPLDMLRTDDKAFVQHLREELSDVVIERVITLLREVAVLRMHDMQGFWRIQ